MRHNAPPQTEEVVAPTVATTVIDEKGTATAQLAACRYWVRGDQGHLTSLSSSRPLLEPHTPHNSVRSG
jgi:hypothetical protein